MGNRQMLKNVAMCNGKPGLAQRQTDSRAARTKIFIQNAPNELAQKHVSDRISVQDISKQAVINRATLYRYYKDKYSLVEEIFKGALRKMAVDLGPPHVFLEPTDLNRALPEERSQLAWAGLFELFASNSQTYTPILSGKGALGSRPG